MNVSVVNRPYTETANRFYVTNRPPLLPSPLVKLPVGSIQPRGWLKRQLELMVNGMTGRLREVSHFLGPQNGWLGGDEDGWEEQPYWLRGFQSLAVLAGDRKLIGEAKRWIEAIFASQQDDGYFGPTRNREWIGKSGRKFVDLWPNMIMLDALISHYEHTGDRRVVPLMTHFFEFCRQLPEETFLPSIPALQEEFGRNRLYWATARAGDMLPHLYWLYNQTGQTWLLDLATRFYQHIAPPTDEWLDHHIVNFTQRFGYPGTYYAQSKAAWHLAATEYWYAQHLSTWGQQPRGIFGADETIRTGCVDPRQGFETCGMVEFAKSFYILGRITGDTVYADRCEDIILNHFPVAQTPDLKALHYLTASNQPQLDASENHEYSNKGRQINYSPHEIYRCCQHNVAMGWPWYVENLWQGTADNGLAAWLYAPGDVTALVGEGTKVIFRVYTDYPFRGRVVMKLESLAQDTFPLYLRVPGWCQGFQVAVNERKLDVSAAPGQYVRLERSWMAGDKVEIEMPMEIALTEWARTGSVTVDRGPLSYSVKIGERWQRCGGTDEWPEWEVLPTTPWNYGLLVNREKPAESLQVVEKNSVADQPWTVEAAPIEIKAQAKRIPSWGLENETVAELRPSPVRSSEPTEEITLIPLGCARLRISCLPVIGEGPDAREWR